MHRLQRSDCHSAIASRLQHSYKEGEGGLGEAEKSGGKLYTELA